MRHLGHVLAKARTGFSTKSDYARKEADQVACCASLGLITTQIKGSKFGNTWLITKHGLEVLLECY
jgi:hypothetical protein